MSELRKFVKEPSTTRPAATPRSTPVSASWTVSDVGGRRPRGGSKNMQGGNRSPANGGGQGRGRTADLPIFSWTLVPTELPGRCPTDHRPGWARRTIPEPAGAHENGSKGPRPFSGCAFRPPT